MLSAVQLQADVDFMIGDLPDKADAQRIATIGANPYDVSRTAVDHDTRLFLEGMNKQYRFSLFVGAAAVEAAGDIPPIGDLITFEAVDYTVINTETDDIDQLLRLDLGEENARGF